MLLGLLLVDERAQNILRASLGAPCDFVFFDFCHIIKVVERAEGWTMLIARVVGDVVSTMKDEKIVGRKLLIVREVTTENEIVGKPIVAIDTVDAGVGDVVLIAQGSSARQTNSTKDTPTDAVIFAIVDSLEVEGKVTFRKS